MSYRGNLILEHLRAIRGEIADVKIALVEVKERFGLVEGQLGLLEAK
jgi:hypothetical protein